MPNKQVTETKVLGAQPNLSAREAFVLSHALCHASGFEYCADDLFHGYGDVDENGVPIVKVLESRGLLVRDDESENSCIYFVTDSGKSAEKAHHERLCQQEDANAK